jgi:hypothetical protein
MIQVAKNLLNSVSKHAAVLTGRTERKKKCKEFHAMTQTKVLIARTK